MLGPNPESVRGRQVSHRSSVAAVADVRGGLAIYDQKQTPMMYRDPMLVSGPLQSASWSIKRVSASAPNALQSARLEVQNT